MTNLRFVSVLAFAFVSLSGSSAFAQDAARQKCCIEMGGRYEALRGRGASQYCQGLGRGSASAYYSCVEKKSGLSKKR